MNRTGLGLLCGIGASAIWGGMYVVSKVVLDVIPPFTLITLRLLLGALTLAGILAWRGWRRPRRADFAPVLGAGLVGYGVSLGFQFVGTRYSTAAYGALVTSATPAFVVCFAVILLGERLNATRVLALLMSSAGVLAVIDPLHAQAEPGMLLGNLSLLAAAVTWALYSVLVRKLTVNTSALPFSALALLGGLPVSVPLGVWELWAGGFGDITWSAVAGVLFLGIVATAVAMFLWNSAFALLDASIASLTFFAQPVVGTALGVAFLGEIMPPTFLIGGLLITLGIVIASRAG